MIITVYLYIIFRHKEIYTTYIHVKIFYMLYEIFIAFSKNKIKLQVSFFTQVSVTCQNMLLPHVAWPRRVLDGQTDVTRLCHVAAASSSSVTMENLSVSGDAPRKMEGSSSTPRPEAATTLRISAHLAATDGGGGKSCLWLLMYGLCLSRFLLMPAWRICSMRCCLLEKLNKCCVVIVTDTVV